MKSSGADSKPSPHLRPKAPLLTRVGELPFIHFALSNPWWSLTVLVFGAGFVAFCFSLVKMWPTTPDGFRPVVRISALDFAQAWSLRRSALRLEREGKTREAVWAWQGAIGNNLGDVESLRAGLNCMLRCEWVQPQTVGRSLNQTRWLLRLANTNAADVPLAASLFGRYERWSDLYGLLQPRRDQLTVGEMSEYLKTLFNLGRMDEFGVVWGRSGPQVSTNAELALYHAAYLAGWGPPESADEGRQELAAALGDSTLRTKANRLRLSLCTQLMDVPGYQEAWRQLEDVRADRLSDRIGYWRLLVSVGRGIEARSLADGYPYLPEFPWQVVELGQAYVDLGMRDFACRFLKRYAPEFGEAWPEIWLQYGNLLLELRRWSDLIEMATHIRLTVSRPVLLDLAGYAYFMEGRAEEALNHPGLAAAAFREAARQTFPWPDLGLKSGITIFQLGYASTAQDVLEPLQKDLADDPRYWQALFEIAFVLKEDAVALYKAAGNAYRLRPHEVMCCNNYAASLLINRWQPAEAVRMTRELLLENPNPVQARLNHAFALTLNQRYDDARAVLAELDPEALGELNRTVYYLITFEIDLNEKQYDQARADLVNIQLAHLFPNQVQWLKRAQAPLSTKEGKGMRGDDRSQRVDEPHLPAAHE